MTSETPNVLVAAVSSDIGRELALMDRAMSLLPPERQDC